ncbi:MAG: M48 family metalloprotease [Pseudomonadota bacterium]
MFTNFIYFIIAILIYSSHIPPDKIYLGGVETAIILIVTLAGYIAFIRRRYISLAQAARLNMYPERLQRRYNSFFSQHATLALVLFAFDIYLLNIKSFIIRIPIISGLPTLTDAFSLLIFIGYLSIIWWYDYESYKALFKITSSRKGFVRTHLALNLPLLFPWLIISLLVDAINRLPFALPKKLLDTPEGQVIIFSLFLIVVSVFLPALIQSFWGCRPLTGPARKRIEDLCNKERLQFRDILLWPAFNGNALFAGVMGIVRQFRYILLTRTLIDILTDEELDAVVAHEIGHVKQKHLIFYLFFIIGFMIFLYAFEDIIRYVFVMTDWLFASPETIGFNDSSIISIIYTLFLAFLFVGYFRFIFGYFMRNCERQADLYAMVSSGHPGALISSFEKLSLFTGTAKKTPSWHHYSIQERIDYLERSFADKKLIGIHNRKLKKSMGIFLVGVVLSGWAGYAINFGSIGKTIDRHFIEAVLYRKIEQAPQNPTLHFIAGSLHYEEKKCGEAIASLEKSLELAPDNPETLNSLAWIFATCEDKTWLNYNLALVYATKAEALKPDPHILDTLAESYYVNGFSDLAITTEKKALEMNPEERDHYEEQLKKFEGETGGL